MKTVAITGGTGYIAGLVIKEFLEAGYEVRASVRSAEKGEQLARLFRSVVGEGVAGRFSAFIADLSKAEGWKDGFRGVDGIIHVASPLGTGKESADELSAISVGGVMHVFQGAKAAGVDRIVMTSSEAAATALRSQAELLTDDFWTDENNPEIDAYRRSKLRSERAAWDLPKKTG